MRTPRAAVAGRSSRWAATGSRAAKTETGAVIVVVGGHRALASQPFTQSGTIRTRTVLSRSAGGPAAPHATRPWPGGPRRAATAERRRATTRPPTRTSKDRALRAQPCGEADAAQAGPARRRPAPRTRRRRCRRQRPGAGRPRARRRFGHPSAPPASIAGLPGRRASVRVGPPLSASGASRGSVRGRSPAPARKQLPSPADVVAQRDEASPGSCGTPAAPASLVLPAMIVLRSTTLPSGSCSESGA